MAEDFKKYFFTNFIKNNNIDIIKSKKPSLIEKIASIFYSNKAENNFNSIKYCKVKSMELN